MTDGSVWIGIVDNDPLAAAALHQALRNQCPDIEVLWVAASGSDALAQLSQTPNQIQVLVTDPHMPTMSGFDLAHAVRSRYHQAHVVGLTAFALPGIEKRAQQSHMVGLLMKDASLTQIVHLIGKAADSAELQVWCENAVITSLSHNERQVLKYYAQGLTSSEIALRLSVSRSTVKTYSSRAFHKLGVHTKAQALVACVRDGLL